MKKIILGVIGNGNHFKKNIHPSIRKIKNIYLKKIYEKGKSKEFFSNNFDIVYIACDTGSHFKFILKCLKKNINVMCEKPLAINIKEKNILTKLATKKNLMLFECLMYRYHKVFDFLKKKIKQNKINYIYSSFKIPSLDNLNFRYKKNNGGFFWDTAIYPLSLENFIINDKNNPYINSSVTKDGNLTLRGNIIIKSKKIERIYKWGENQKYENNIEIIMKNKTFFINKFFSKKKNEVIIFEIFDKFKVKKYKFKDDQFLNMFKYVVKNYNSKKFKNKSITEINNHFNLCYQTLKNSKIISI